MGSPAGLPRAEAEQYLRRDRHSIDTLRWLWATQDIRYPHIGGECDRCRRVQ